MRTILAITLALLAVPSIAGPVVVSDPAEGPAGPADTALLPAGDGVVVYRGATAAGAVRLWRRALAVWTGADGLVRALTWTEAALPVPPGAWGALHGLYRGKR